MADKLITTTRLGEFLDELIKIFNKKQNNLTPGNNITISGSTISATVPTKLSDLNDDATHRLVTDTEKNTWNNKANSSDIPTSLPANGGNADTVDNKHASDFADASHTHTKLDITDFPEIPNSYAPTDAEKNTIVGIQKNGTDLTVDDNRKVNITVPTKVSDLENDTGYKTTWRGIQDNLTSDSTTDSLSAKQGKVLKGLIDDLYTAVTQANNLLEEL